MIDSERYFFSLAAQPLISAAIPIFLLARRMTIPAARDTRLPAPARAINTIIVRRLPHAAEISCRCPRQHSWFSLSLQAEITHGLSANARPLFNNTQTMQSSSRIAICRYMGFW